MRSPLLRYALAAGVALATLAAGGAPAAAKPRPVDVQLLSYTDFHGYITPMNNVNDGTIKDAQGNTLIVGGAPYIATHLKRLREGKRNTITFSTGDAFSGWPVEVSQHADEPTIEFMNKIGTSFNAVGNHELDRSLEFLRDHIGKGECFGVVGEDSCFLDSDGQMFGGAKFTTSSANITMKGSTEPIFAPYLIKRFGNVKVGFINLTTPTTVTGSTSYQPSLGELPLVETANKYAAELSRRGVKAIVVNLHEGGAAGTDFNGCNSALTGPVADFAKNASPEIDAIITGHWHAAFNCSIPDPAGNPRPVVEASNHGRLLNEMNLKIDVRTKDVIRDSIVSVNHAVTRDVTPDPEMVTMVDYWNAKAKETYARPVAKITGDLTRVRDADGESTLGNTVADAAYADGQTTGGGADLAMVAVAPVKGSNSLRGDLLYAKGANPADSDGTVLFGEAWAAWGYANPVLTVSVTGAQIEQALEQQWQTQANGTVRFAPLAVSGNVRFSYDLSKAVGDRVLPQNVLINGQPLDPAKTYRLAALAYTLLGADGYTAFAGYTDAIRGERDYEAFRTYLRKAGTLTPPALDRAIALPAG
ncbi:bifunctional metallophosphatase/5'-nucleotidase [Nonomuraea sp. NPDC050310]|uniref:bifunctional metallophosphatase/5'-nucleotidase n=1 Tax=Nonomuraea sp. NPDC050310 TaxID=3154935 RepID=UPI0033ED35D4